MPPSGWIPTRATALKIAVCYAGVSSLWILWSGALLHHLVHDPNQLALWENVKGWLFVAVTALALGLALNQYFHEIRRAAQLLEDSEQRWESALKGTGQEVWDWNVMTGEVIHSNRWKAMLGYEPHELSDTFDDWAKCVHPDDLPLVKREIQRHLDGHTPMYSSEYRICCKDGSFKWVLDQGKITTRAADGKPLRMIGTYSDITERKQAEEVTRQRLELQDQVAKIAATVPGMIYSFRLRPDGSASMPFATPAIEELWGLRPEEVANDFSPAIARVHADDVEHLTQGIFNSSRTLEPWQDSFRVRHPRHGEIWLEGRSIPRAEADGSVLWHGFVQNVTQRMRSQETLEAALAKYRTLFDAFPLGITVVDQQGRIVEVNCLASKILGISSDEQRQRTIYGKEWNLVRPNGTPMPTEEHVGVRALKENRLIENVEVGLVKSSTETIWLNVTATPLPLGDRTVVVAFADVSERKRAQEALSREAHRRRILFEEAIDGIVVQDENLRIVEANDSFVRMIGYDSLEEILPLYPWDWDAVFTTREKLLAAWPELPSTPQSFTTKFRRRDGKLIDVEITTNPAEWAGQKLVFNVCRDITARKQTETSLQESLLFRREAERISRVGAWKVNPKTDYLYWTEGVYSIIEEPLDYKPGLKEGMKYYDAESIPLLQEALNRALEDGTPFLVEAGITTRTGKHRWTEVRGLGRVSDDEQAYVMGTFQDITDRKALESQLRQAQKLEAIGQLAGGVAHDFNNILAAIMMHLGLLQMNPALDEHTRQALKELEAAARRAANLTRQLLMFSRRSVLAVKPLDLNEVVENLLKMLRRLIGEHIDLRFDGKSNLPLVEADAGMLEQVLMNLAVNARDAMPKGGRITITTNLVELSAAEATLNLNRLAGRFVQLSVADTGAGMDSDTLKRLFEPFFTTKEAGKGTGLGLATVHGIAAQHKGWVEVESQVGQGTTFRVFLPATTHAPAEALPAQPPEPVQRGKETILLVEDDASVRQVVARSLRALGYKVYEAGNGQEAVTLWQIHGTEVDLLLTDMVMPEGMTGLELTERLQALKPGLQAVITSGYSAEIAHAGVPNKAGVSYLPKPYATKVLAQLIRDCLDPKG